MSQNFAKYVDIPLQHVNNDILKQMNRRDDRSDIERLLKKIRNAPTHITLRTSIIVGFLVKQTSNLRNFATL